MEKETFESVLKEKLGNHELPVNPALWKSVSTQAGLSSGSAGLSFSAWIGIASSILAIAVGVVYFTSANEKPATANLEKNTVEKTIKLPNNKNMSECRFIYFEIRSASLYPIQAIGM